MLVYYSQNAQILPIVQDPTHSYLQKQSDVGDRASLEVKMPIPVLMLLLIPCAISNKFLGLSGSIFNMWCWMKSLF